MTVAFNRFGLSGSTIDISSSTTTAALFSVYSGKVAGEAGVTTAGSFIGSIAKELVVVTGSVFPSVIVHVIVLFKERLVGFYELDLYLIF